MPRSSKCVCVSDRNRNKKRERGSAKRWLQTHTHTRGSLVRFYFFFLSLPLRWFVCAPLHANTHREPHNYFTLYPPQYEITAYRHVLQCTLVMKVNAGWRGIREREYGGKRCKKNFVRTLSLWHFHTKNLLWCLQHDYMLWSMNLSAHVRLCDMCLFLDEAIRGNYNATVSTASFASLCSSSCTMRGKQWCFFFSPLNSLSFFYQVSLHGYNEPHHSDTWVQQRESHCRQAIETGEKGNRRRVGWGSVEWWQANRELFFAVFPWLFTIIGGHCEEDSCS